MPSISFIYRLGNGLINYTGKYDINYLSDEHNGLYNEIMDVLYPGLNEFRIINNLPLIKKRKYIKIGILSSSTNDDWLNYTSNKEYKAFDFYYKSYENNNVSKTFVNGKLILYYSG